MLTETLINRVDNPKYLLICLPSDKNSGLKFGMDFEAQLKLLGVKGVQVINLHNQNSKWYEKPDSVFNKDAVEESIKNSVELLNEKLEKLNDKFKIDYNNMFLTGFSYGATICLEYITRKEKELGCVLSHAGKLISKPSCHNKTKIVLFHNQDDAIFPWSSFQETENLLKEHEFYVKNYTKFMGGHTYKVTESTPFVLTKIVAG